MKFKVACGLSALILLFSLVSCSVFSDPTPAFEPPPGNYVMVDWGETFDTLDELIAESEICVTGEVISQEVKDENLYWTFYNVEASDGNTYRVLMTGAFVDGMAEDVITDTYLMEVGKSYFLCLELAPDDDETYYNIMGGNQGYGFYDPDTGEVTAINFGERALFSSFEVQKGLDGYNIYNLEPAAGTEEK